MSAVKNSERATRVPALTIAGILISATLVSAVVSYSMRPTPEPAMTPNVSDERLADLSERIGKLELKLIELEADLEFKVRPLTVPAK